MSIATAEIRRRAIDAYKMGKGSQADIASSYRVDLRTFQPLALSFQRNRTDCSPTAWASSGPLQAITQAFEELSPDEVIGWFSSCYIATPQS
ncbi:MAG: hypothetical protein GKR87_03470 [Kiritimatiellae bacterium]|nr:hypothetical protein [Kiritimatiellia bacterium]